MRPMCHARLFMPGGMNEAAVISLMRIFKPFWSITRL
jgi:hypothetical protein